MNDTERLAALETSLQQRICEANKASQQPLSVEEVTSIVKQVVTSLSGDVSATDLKFYAELQDLAGYIRRAKTEIAAIQPKEISASHIPHATDELDAVVGATEEATNKIMDACDAISLLGESCTPEIKDKLILCTTGIFEACNFQDITGQRISKVVHTLKYIDGKIGALLEALGEEIHHSGGVTEEKGEDLEKALLNGPQLPQNAIGQDDIDKLLSGG